MKRIFWIPLVILLLLVGFISGVIYTYDHPVYEETEVVEGNMEKCIRLCNNNSVKDCFQVCLDKLTCDNQFLLI